MVIKTIRCMWSLKKSTTVNFKIITDTDEGIKLALNSICALKDIDKVAVEYLHEYDVSKIGVCQSVFHDGEFDKDYLNKKGGVL